ATAFNFGESISLEALPEPRTGSRAATRTAKAVEPTAPPSPLICSSRRSSPSAASPAPLKQHLLTKESSWPSPAASVLSLCCCFFLEPFGVGTAFHKRQRGSRLDCLTFAPLCMTPMTTLIQRPPMPQSTPPRDFPDAIYTLYFCPLRCSIRLISRCRQR